MKHMIFLFRLPIHMYILDQKHFPLPHWVRCSSVLLFFRWFLRMWLILNTQRSLYSSNCAVLHRTKPFFWDRHPVVSERTFSRRRKGASLSLSPGESGASGNGIGWNGRGRGERRWGVFDYRLGLTGGKTWQGEGGARCGGGSSHLGKTLP